MIAFAERISCESVWAHGVGNVKRSTPYTLRERIQNGLPGNYQFMQTFLYMKSAWPQTLGLVPIWDTQGAGVPTNGFLFVAWKACPQIGKGFGAFLSGPNLDHPG